MDKVTAKKVVSGTKIRYKQADFGGANGRKVATVYGIDNGQPGADPRIKYPLFDLRYPGSMDRSEWVTYRLLEVVV